jgi:hypothetical protein
LEALRVWLTGSANDIARYQAFVQDTNWQAEVCDGQEVHGSNRAASADSYDKEGVWWLVRVITRLNRFALATYNTEIQRDGEMREARAILGDIVFVD